MIDGDSDDPDETVIWYDQGSETVRQRLRDVDLHGKEVFILKTSFFYKRVRQWTQ